MLRPCYRYVYAINVDKTQRPNGQHFLWTDAVSCLSKSRTSTNVQITSTQKCQQNS